jgi:hypothetical protein
MGLNRTELMIVRETFELVEFGCGFLMSRELQRTL